jgi:acid phosphatase
VSAASAKKVLVIVEENHSLAEMQAGMPYLNGLAQQYSYATNYAAVSHPSEPNYLAIAGGSTFGDTANHNPAYQVSGQSVFGQADTANGQARLYAEGMTAPCQQTDSPPYYAKHNPWASFTDEAGMCQTDDVPSGDPSSGPLHDDAVNGTLPKVGMIVPDVDHDAHDGTLADADTWLQGWLTLIMAGPDYQSGNLAIVVTADEDDYTSGNDNRVLTIVVHPSLDGAHKVVATPLDHYSLSGFCSSMSGSPALGNAASAPSFADAFGITTSTK